VGLRALLVQEQALVLVQELLEPELLEPEPQQVSPPL
jgi:hypothetical protein